MGPEGKDLGLFCRKGAEAEPKCINGVREDVTASRQFPRTSQAISCFPGMRDPCSGKRHLKRFPDVSGRKTPWAIGSPSCPTPRVSQRGCRHCLPRFPFPIKRSGAPRRAEGEEEPRGWGCHPGGIPAPLVQLEPRLSTRCLGWVARRWVSRGQAPWKRRCPLTHKATHESKPRVNRGGEGVCPAPPCSTWVWHGAEAKSC